MNKKLKGLVFLITSVMLVTSLAGCKKNPSESATESITKAKDPVELKVFFFGEENKHMRNVDPVIKAFQDKTKNTLNTTLKVTWTPPADYFQKLPLWVASGEDMDLVFADPMRVQQLGKDGAFADLASYFGNDKYPGLKKAFSTEYINNNKFFNKSIAVPITNTFMDMEGVWYRKDLLTKYGMKDITSYDDLYNYCAKAQEQDGLLYSNYGAAAFFKLFSDPNARQLEGKVFSYPAGHPAGDYINVQIADDGKSVKAVAAYGDSDDVWKDFNTKYGKQYLYDEFNQCVKFSKFLPKDILTGSSTNTGKASSAGFVTISNFQNELNKQKSTTPSIDLGFFPIYKNNREMTPGTQSTEFKAWNFLCVPASSKKIDRTMDFLNWVYEDQENNDLFNYGIEGLNWVPVGDKQWKLPDGVDPKTNYMFPGYQLTWNPTLQRMPSGLPAEVQKYYEYEFRTDTFKKNAIAGFTFNSEPVKNEIAKCKTVADKYLPFLCSGINDVDTNMKLMNKELKDAGVDRLKEEYKKQINEFLANKK